VSRKIVILFVFACLQIPMFAKHDHHHIHDEDYNYHIRIGLGGAKFLDETGFNPAFYLHFSYIQQKRSACSTPFLKIIKQQL